MAAGRKSLPAVMTWRNALRDSDIDQTAKLLGFVLSTYLTAEGRAGHDGRPAPSRATLARGVGVSVRTVDRRLDDLEKAGLLSIERSQGRRTNAYTAKLPNGVTAVSQLQRRHSCDNGDTGDAPTATPVTSNGDTAVTHEVDLKRREGDDDDVVADHQKEEELEELLALFGTFTRAQRETVRAAWTERAEGVRALAEETFGARGVRSPVGLFMSRIADGEHRTIEIKPPLEYAPLPECKPCPECNFSMGGHRYGCSLAPDADRTTQGDCPECGYGGARPHLADCKLAPEATA